MIVGLYFGSFNPIHNGHINIAKEILKKTDINNIWIILSPNSPSKSSLLDKNIRYRLMEMAFIGVEGISISNIEFNMPQPNYTYKTLKKIKKEFPGKEFKIIMGQDNYENINSWREHQYITDNYEIVVYPRDKKNNNSKFSEVFNVSSSQIRNNIRSKMSIDGLVPKNIEEEIHANKYYIK